MKIDYIHPFPARMAPELAISAMELLEAGSVVLDPMVGSGVVVRHAVELGHNPIGMDTDPLAILISRVWTTSIKETIALDLLQEVLHKVEKLVTNPYLPWIDDDLETSQFIDFWFAKEQQITLRKLAYVLWELRRTHRRYADVLRVALSRIIITKSSGASLARDISHSRPHKVADKSDFDVRKAFEASARRVVRILSSAKPVGKTKILRGDARRMSKVRDGSIDAVVTSPPYLNAIDYVRGHKFSLVWLGYTVGELRQIRSSNIGAEKGLDKRHEELKAISNEMGKIEELSNRQVGMIVRYSEDVYKLMSEVGRVLKPRGKAILIVGNSCLNGVFIRNSNAVAKAASMLGLLEVAQVERPLPNRNRYLPIPKDSASALGKRMRTETILTFVKE